MRSALIFACILAAQPALSDDATCPVTSAGDNTLARSYGLGGQWVGDERLAAQLPVRGWTIMSRPGQRISAKQLFWSLDFQSHMVQDLEVTIAERNGGEVLAEVRGITNAMIGNRLYMMIGVAVHGPGCWEVTGTYHGHSVSFIVETKAEGGLNSTSSSSRPPPQH